MERDLEKEDRLKKYQNDLFWNIVFQELDRLIEKLDEAEKEEAFIKLYYEGERAHKIELLKEKIPVYKNIGANYLISGIAGVGKTTFIERILSEKNFFKNAGVYFAYVKSDKKSKDSYLIRFIEELKKYFDVIGNPFRGTNNLDNSNGISNAINDIARHLDSVETPKYMPLVFIDDLDYVENEWKEIISEINHFIFSTKIGICITMRPRLFAQLSNSDDRTTRNFDDSRSITLMPIPIRELVYSKIFLILKEYETYKTSPIKETIKKLINYIKHWDRADNTLLKVLQSHGVENVENLHKINYPFNSAFEEFMQKATGNNLRRMFLIIRKSITFILNGGVLEEDTTGHWKLRKDSIRDLFFNVENPEIEYKVLNIHFERSDKTGKSICYYILKIMSNNALKNAFDIEDEKFISAISDAVGGGITNKNIVLLIQKLSERNYALIDLVKNTGTKEKYEISEKGRYYLNELSKWQEYKEVFGSEDAPITIS
jgi:nucleoside-triphosphatase THEP1